MPRVTKAMLEQDVKIYKQYLEENRIEISYLRGQIELYETFSKGPFIAQRIALEKTTEAVAHVLSDLKRRTP